MTEAIKMAMDIKKNRLKAAYREAENEPDSQETIRDWAALDGEDWDA